MTIISTKELNIYFEKSAYKTNGPLLYIGGTGGDLRNKPNQLHSPLSEAFEVLSYDQRGLGQTSKPTGDYSMQQYADDAADLLDELSIEAIPVMGVSFGGMVAQELVKRHPSRVSKLANKAGLLPRQETSCRYRLSMLTGGTTPGLIVGPTLST